MMPDLELPIDNPSSPATARVTTRTAKPTHRAWDDWVKRMAEAEAARKRAEDRAKKAANKDRRTPRRRRKRVVDSEEEDDNY